MLNRVLEINHENISLSLFRGFIQIKESGNLCGTVPLDDIAVLLLSAQSTVLSKNILNALAEKGCITILCGNNYIPVSMVLPVYDHYLFTKNLKMQINSTLPLKKRIWQKIVEEKLRNQALVLRLSGDNEHWQEIKKISGFVKSGDTENREAWGAKIYWKALFGKDFIRDKNGKGINALLNYGYAIIRASMARAVCSRGLLPALGIHHENFHNQFCLVDDLFEIYRPFVDYIVFKLVKYDVLELEREIKKELISVLHIKMNTSSGFSPLGQSMFYMVDSFIDCIARGVPELLIPNPEVVNNDFTLIE